VVVAVNVGVVVALVVALVVAVVVGVVSSRHLVQFLGHSSWPDGTTKRGMRSDMRSDVM
jgi:hypothetical protein